MIEISTHHLPPGRGNRKHMLAVAQKKPRVQAAIDNRHTLTDIEIDQIPDLPSWIRKELKLLCGEHRKRESGYLTPEQIAEIMISKSSI